MGNHKEQVEEMERCIKEDIADTRFIPYIQLHEFEALLFSSSKGFQTFFSPEQQESIQTIIHTYDNPEEINTTPEGAPSKRLLTIKEDYDKVLEGNLIALEIGLPEILEKCPRFKAWMDTLVQACK